MKHFRFRTGLMAAVIAASLLGTSCKSKSKDTNTSTNTADTTMTYTAPAAPVEVSGDETLNTNVKDATKDFPGVNATITNGEITLTGSIERSKLQTLLQSLNTLHAKKINNNLTIK